MLPSSIVLNLKPFSADYIPIRLWSSVRYPTAQAELAGSPREIQLQILDSGVGFDPKATGSRGGLGLISMRERLILLGGELLIESRPSGNTWIKACLPLDSSASPIEHPSEITN